MTLRVIRRSQRNWERGEKLGGKKKKTDEVLLSNLIPLMEAGKVNLIKFSVSPSSTQIFVEIRSVVFVYL